jgi:hypothetical protein
MGVACVSAPTPGARFGALAHALTFVAVVVMCGITTPLSPAVVTIWCMKTAGLINFPDFDRGVVRKLFPLPIFFILNLLSGLGGTKRINVRAHTSLFRTS